MDSKMIAEHLHGWLSKQDYCGQSLLHAAVCCDFVGVTRFKKALAEQIDIALASQPNAVPGSAEDANSKPFVDLLCWYQYDATISTGLTVSEVLDLWYRKTPA